VAKGTYLRHPQRLAGWIGRSVWINWIDDESLGHRFKLLATDPTGFALLRALDPTSDTLPKPFWANLREIKTIEEG
jgi:hypothetical protein